jgi:RNA polymerase sigma-70 factor (ECF subfamily)
VEEVMMDACRQFGSLPEGTDLRTSLYRALANAYTSSRTRHRRLAEIPIDTNSDRQPQAAAERSSTGLRLAQAEALEALPTAAFAKALHALERDTRMAVYYADVEGLSYKEIGDITNRSVIAVTSLLHCGRDQLRCLLLAACVEPVLEEGVTPEHSPRHRSSEGDVCAGHLDWFDREIVRYVLQWAPEGDVWDEDVYPVFGMTVEQLVDRFRRIIATFVPRLGYLATSDRELLYKGRNLSRIFGQAL